MKIEGGIAIDSVHIQPSPENSKLMPRIAHLPPDPIKPAEEVHSDTINKNISVVQKIFLSLECTHFLDIPIFHSQQAAKQPAERDPHIAKLPICYGYMLVKF